MTTEVKKQLTKLKQVQLVDEFLTVNVLDIKKLQSKIKTKVQDVVDNAEKTKTRNQLLLFTLLLGGAISGAYLNYDGKNDATNAQFIASVQRVIDEISSQESQTNMQFLSNLTNLSSEELNGLLQEIASIVQALAQASELGVRG